MKIGVLDIQGSVEEHFEALKKLSGRAIGRAGRVAGSKALRAAERCVPVLVKKASDLSGVRGLIIPGGESTTIGKLLRRFGLREEIIKRFRAGGLAIWGTCAGAILLAMRVEGHESADTLGLMDITVERNAYGKQVDSFEGEVEFEFEKGVFEKISAIFIRAPKILKVGRGVKVLAKNEDEIVAAVCGKLLVTTFHPELTESLKIHEYFAGLCR